MKSNKSLWVALGMLLAISALAYLPLVNRFGYFNDDWYSMYDARTQGAQFFHEVFSSDRPGRAYVMIPLYAMFGANPLPYNLTAYLFRFLGGVSLLWILNILWPHRRFFGITTAILFTIYPGFLSQHNAIDYQSHILALFLALLSIALTLKAVLTQERNLKILLALASILLGWAYLSQMEYFIGVEVFRVACIFLLVWRSLQSGTLEKFRAAVMAWLPYVIIPAAFLFWRLFFFQTERRATDIGFQVGQIFSSPLLGLWWLIYLTQDLFNLMVVAWGLPLSIFVFPMRLQNQLIGLGLAALAVLVFVIGHRGGDVKESETLAGSIPRGMREEFWISLMSILGGLAPVIFVNRHIILPDYSRYSLIASVGAVILLVAFIERIPVRHIRMGAASLLIVIAVLTHYGNSVKAAVETETVRNFWWQVAWRAPGLKPGTTLIASYPASGIQEDYFVWGPANFIYYPEQQNTIPIEIKLPAAVLTRDVITQILSRKGTESPLRRGNQLTRDFENVLVLSQADPNSCVRIMDGNLPELSVSDEEKIMLVAQASKLENVLVLGATPTPPAIIFGDEPVHDWCYYYQKASLARQQGDWQLVVQLGDDARQLGLHPNDQIEWLPFLQAYAIFGDQKELKEISTRINTEPFYQRQACQNLNALTGYGYVLSSEIQSQVGKLFCKKQ